MTPPTQETPQRQRRQASQAHQDAIRAAALDVFATQGFDGASTRQIAAAAGFEVGHLSYYYPSKEALWRDVVSAWQPELQALLAAGLQAVEGLPAAQQAALVMPDVLRYFAHHPKLARLMLHELSVSSPRHDWVVDTLAKPVWLQLQPLFEALETQGALDGADAATAYFTLITSAIAMFGSSQEIQRISGLDVGQEARVEQHIRLLMRTLTPLGASAVPSPRTAPASPARARAKRRV
jgi:TetR/AcrR family transcriptional regulator